MTRDGLGAYILVMTNDTMTNDATPRTAVWFVRCADCLAIGAVDCAATRGPDPGVCPCGGRVEVMGRVHRDRLVTQHEDTACDYACTGARGPKCGCRCGSVNHGTGRKITVTVDRGAAPRYALAPDDARAAEYRAAVAEAETRIAHLNRGDVVARKLRGEYLSGADFATYRDVVEARQSLSRARAGRAHKSRLAAVARVARREEER